MMLDMNHKGTVYMRKTVPVLAQLTEAIDSGKSRMKHKSH